MSFALRRTLDPSSEPFTVDQMKNYLRADDDADDALIADIIRAARERVEDLTGTGLMRQQYTFAMDAFPRHGEIILPRGPVLSVDSITYLDADGQRQTLPTYQVDLFSTPARIRASYRQDWPPHRVAMNSVQITFTVGYEQTLSETILVPTDAPYAAVAGRPDVALALVTVTDQEGSTVAESTLAGGLVTFPDAAAGQTVKVDYTIRAVPAPILQAIRLICAAYYDNRAEVVQGSGNFNQLPMPLSVQSLLAPYEVFKVGYPQEVA